MVELDKQGIEHEANFWKDFVKSDRFLVGWCSKEKTHELNQKVYDFLQKVKPEKVLDVGSGPVSLLYGSVENVQTCDPLAEEYKQLVDYSTLGIPEPMGYAAENIPEEHDNTYDVVHCSNALDHVVDPFEAYARLFECVKPGGYLIIQNHVDEAIHENYQGFHKWNISLKPGGLHIRGKFVTNFVPRVDSSHELILAETERLVTGRDWVIWVVKKN